MAKWFRKKITHKYENLNCPNEKEDVKMSSEADDVKMSSEAERLEKELLTLTEQLNVTKAKLQSSEEELNCLKKRLTDINYKWHADENSKDELVTSYNNKQKRLEVAEKVEEIKSLRAEVEQLQRKIVQLKKACSKQKKNIQKKESSGTSRPHDMGIKDAAAQRKDIDTLKQKKTLMLDKFQKPIQTPESMISNSDGTGIEQAGLNQHIEFEAGENNHA